MTLIGEVNLLSREGFWGMSWKGSIVSIILEKSVRVIVLCFFFLVHTGDRRFYFASSKGFLRFRRVIRMARV